MKEEVAPSKSTERGLYFSGVCPHSTERGIRIYKIHVDIRYTRTYTFTLFPYSQTLFGSGLQKGSQVEKGCKNK